MLRITAININHPDTGELVQSVGMDYRFERKAFDTVVKKLTSEFAANYPGKEIEIRMKNENDEVPD